MEEKDRTEAVNVFGTPLYVYDANRVRENGKRLSSLLAGTKSKIFFALMCNNVSQILEIIKELGFGVQINSLFELDIVKKVGFLPENISFTSTGLSKQTLQRIISDDIFVNLDSQEEVEKFCSITKNKKFGIRMRIPEHMKISSDQATNTYRESNVGIEFKNFGRIKNIAKNTNNHLVGIHGYFASNVLNSDSFIEFGNILAESAYDIPELEYINFGSGFGIKSSQDEKDLNIKEVLEYYEGLAKNVSLSLKREIPFFIEPGRILVADSGYLLTKVSNIKKIHEERSEIAVDAGFGELIRPRLYGSYHEIKKIENESRIENNGKNHIYDIRGNTVLQNDFLGRDRYFKNIEEGDILVIKNVGAYGSVISSGFPGKGKPKQVVFSKGKFFEI